MTKIEKWSTSMDTGATSWAASSAPAASLDMDMRLVFGHLSKDGTTSGIEKEAARAARAAARALHNVSATGGKRTVPL